MRQSVHIPVMTAEVMKWLHPQTGQTFVDGTLGGGGHTRCLAEAVGEFGRVISLDRDLSAVERAESALANLPVRPIHANYSDIPEILAELDIDSVQGVLLDVGLSSDQLEDRERGFSFQSDGPLDLRFDTTRGEPAWKLLETAPAGAVSRYYLSVWRGTL